MATSVSPSVPPAGQQGLKRTHEEAELSAPCATAKEISNGSPKISEPPAKAPALQSGPVESEKTKSADPPNGKVESSDVVPAKVTTDSALPATKAPTVPSVKPIDKAPTLSGLDNKTELSSHAPSSVEKSVNESDKASFPPSDLPVSNKKADAATPQIPMQNNAKPVSEKVVEAVKDSGQSSANVSSSKAPEVPKNTPNFLDNPQKESLLQSESSKLEVEAKSLKPEGQAKSSKPELQAKSSTSSTTVVKSNTSHASKEDGGEPEKKSKQGVSNNSVKSNKSPEQILEYMDKTFDQRRKIITKQMPTIPQLKELYPDLFMGKQLLIEFQRITKIDIDQKIQEFCVRYATAVIEMARDNPGSAPVLARWECAKQENETLKQYWDMVTALCLLPLHFGEDFSEMVIEIGEDEEVVPQGKIVPTLVARGNIFRTDEFFLIAENTIVQEFEEFTIAFASLYSSYWVFNMVYPATIENTYNYIQRCIVRQREPGAIPVVCKNFTKSLQKWNKGREIEGKENK